MGTIFLLKIFFVAGKAKIDVGQINYKNYQKHFL